MTSFVRYEVTDRVAVLTIDNPPVNALSPGVPEAIAEAVARALQDDACDAIVLIGAGTTFVAGADIHVFDQLTTREQSIARSEGVHARWRAVEDTSKPIVCAIHGNALGGGLELAMACHYRVADADAKLGQPEVLLGLIPGAGGTQRLPRLCGVGIALDMCTNGKPISAARAREAGLIDHIVDGDLLSGAIAYAKEQAGSSTRRTREVSVPVDNRRDNLAAVHEMRRTLGGTARGLSAPLAAVDAIEAAITMDFDLGSRREREIFADCVVSTESKALRHLFFAEREVAKVPGLAKGTPKRPIRRAAVLGAGTMGGGIAMAYANAGIPVLLKDVDQAAVDRGMALIRKNYESAVTKGRMTPDSMARTMALVTPTTTYDGFGELDIVVEAVFEDMALKRTTFQDLALVTAPTCILATNTSALDVDEIAVASGRPEQVVGHHFFSPAHVMKLLEIVRGRDTSAEVIATSLALAKTLNKIGVVVGNCLGFVANRMLAYYMREAYLLLEEGASVPEIDDALTEFGMPVGPFGMQDIAGIDVGWRIRQYLKSLGKTRADGPQSEVPDRMYELGRYGQKTGAGWYRYEAGSRARIPDGLVDEIAADEAKKRGVSRRAIGREEIIARITTALANEGARVLEDGYALRAGDIDVVYVHGFGFPRHRGGPMFYADTVGLPTVLARVDEYRRTLGDYWTPAPLLTRLVAEGRGFHQYAADRHALRARRS